jgi:hypothetical protein
MRIAIFRKGGKLMLAAAVVASILASFAGVGTAYSAEEDKEKIALSLANLLRAARSVISDNQEHINDHREGFKGLSSDMVILTAKEYYEIDTGQALDDIDPSSLQGELIRAELDAIAEVMDEVQERINRKGVGFKGFLPDIFAVDVAKRFRAKAGATASLKVTAPRRVLRNRANAPDKWEDGVIEKTLVTKDHPKGQHVTVEMFDSGKQAFRLVLPEYYRQSCLQCHGGPKGSYDITGRKKEGAVLGDLGGVISVSIFGS